MEPLDFNKKEEKNLPIQNEFHCFELYVSLFSNKAKPKQNEFSKATRMDCPFAFLFINLKVVVAL